MTDNTQQLFDKWLQPYEGSEFSKFEVYQKELKRFAYNLLRQRGQRMIPPSMQPSDLVQQAFLKTLTVTPNDDAQEEDEDARLFTLLKINLVNEYKDYLKRKWAEKRPKFIDVSTPPEIADDRTPSKNVETQRLYDKIAQLSSTEFLALYNYEAPDIMRIAEQRPDLVFGFLDAWLNLIGRDAKLANVVELRIFAGLTHEQIAHALGVSEKTARNYWTEAQRKIRRRMDSHDLNQ